jgi:hypothetical protein
MRMMSPPRHKDTDAALCVFVSWWFLFLSFPWSTIAAQHPGPQVKTSVDATAITIGDILTLKLEVRHLESLKIGFPAVGATLGEWVVRGSNRSPSKPAEGGFVEDVWALQLTVYKTGEFEIPALEIEAASVSGEKASLNSEPVKIKVQSVLSGSDAALKDVKPQADIAADYKPFLLFLAALGSAVYLIYRLIQRFRKRKAALPTLPQETRTPEEIAREAIRQLLARKLIEQGFLKDFYLELSEIVKRFLGLKLGIPSLERTTQEFTRDLRATAIPPDRYQMIRDFLEDCDLVKFAKYRPGTDEVRHIVARSNEIVDTFAVKQLQPEPVLEAAR